MRKAELIELFQNNQRPPRSGPPGAPGPADPWEPNHPPRPNRPPPDQSTTQTWEPIDDRLRPELEAGRSTLCIPLTKRQLKHRQNKDSKQAKKFKSLNAEIDDLKSQIKVLKDKIMRASKSTNARFKRKKTRSMKHEVNKIAEKLAESEKKFEAVEARAPEDPISKVPLKLHPPNRNKCIEAKIADLNKKIRRTKNRRNKECLIAKREALYAEGPGY